MTIVGVVLAAGRGERFAQADPSAPPKMLAPIDGKPMVRRVVLSLVEGGVDWCLVVVSATGAEAIGAALARLPVRLVVNPDPDRGMFSSVQCGLRAVDDADLSLIMPGDMPFVDPETIAALVAEAEWSGQSVAPILDGHRGHPVVCTAALRARIVAAPADSRLDEVLARVAIREAVVDDQGVRRDWDRPS